MTYTFTWDQFTKLIVVLFVAYWLIKLLKKGLENFPIFSEFRTAAITLLRKFLILFQPLAYIIALSVFVFINPVLHGVIMGLVLIFSFLHLKNYLSGRLVLLDGTITPGKHITVNGTSGTIGRCGHLGIQVMTPEGINHISYSNLLGKGYTITPDEPGSYHCKLQVSATSDKPPAENLKDLLHESPYIDSEHGWIIQENQSHNSVECHVYYPENLNELIESLKESGYIAKRV